MPDRVLPQSTILLFPQAISRIICYVLRLIILLFASIVTSSGELCIFEIQNEPIKLTLVTSKTIDNQPVVLSLEWQNLNLVTSDSSGTITTWKYDSEGKIYIWSIRTV